MQRFHIPVCMDLPVGNFVTRNVGDPAGSGSIYGLEVKGVYYTSLKGVLIYFQGGGDPGDHKGEILGGKENSEQITSGGNGHAFLLFIPSICFLGY